MSNEINEQPDEEVDEEVISVVKDFVGKYTGLVKTFAGIAVHAQEYGIGKLQDATEDDKREFLEWCHGQFGYWVVDLKTKHGMDIDKKEMQI